ncbi:MFS transporter [Nocardia alni]|uniref:MFS transporter n=1 Tax=Nocardia alni TaxID=2815723 RepID=UPI001C22FA39|nr:MFS transporter [Nocardia alni]
MAAPTDIPPTALDLAARIDRLPGCRYLAGLTARIALGGWFEFYELFLAGYISLGLLGSGLYQQKSGGYFDWSGFAAFTASFFAGMFLSTVAFSRIPDRYGRRSTFTVSMVGYSVAALLIVTAPSSGWIDLWRFIAGFAVGIQLVNNDSFMSELAPKAIRGRYVALGFVVILTAVPIVALLAWLLVPHAPLGLSGWRWVMLIGAVGGLLVWFARRGLPESPRWLAARGRLAEAATVVDAIEARVVAQTGRPLPDPAPTAAEPVIRAGSWREVFGRRYGRRTLMLSIFQFCQTIGVYGFSNWAAILLVHRGLTVVNSLGYSFLIAWFTPLGGLLAFAVADKVERKWQLAVAAAGIGVFGMVFAEARWIGLVIVGGAVVTLCSNWLIGIFHTYAAELFPTRIRARAVGFSFSWSRLSQVFVGYWVADLLADYGTAGVFVFIAIAMVVVIVAVGGFGPKTNGKRLEEISP